MKIREYIRINAWSKFVENHPKGNIFQTPEMYEVYFKTKNFEPVLITVIDDDEVLGVLLAVIQREYKGILGSVSSRAIIIGGPLIKNDDTKVLEFILKAYNRRIKNRAVISQFRNLWSWDDFKPVFKKYGFEYDEHLDILINIDVDEKELNSTIKRGKRRNLTKSRNKGVTLKEINEINELQDGLALIKSTYSRINLPLPDDSLFHSAFNTMNKSGYIKVFGAYVDEKIIGVRMVLNYKNLIYDWYAGSDDEYRNMYPNDFLIFNVLLWGLETNYTIFDFGGAGKPNIPYGVRDHKMKFGGELVEFGRFEKVHQPFLMEIAKIGLKLWKKIKR